MFSNRDYVFNRRYFIDQEKNIIVVINKGTEHSNVPEKPQNHRVKDYWSYMVIKAYTNIDEVSNYNMCQQLLFWGLQCQKRKLLNPLIWDHKPLSLDLETDLRLAQMV